MQNDDFPAWLPLWNGNNQGHKDDAVTTETWTRLIDPQAQVFGLVAQDQSSGALLGLVHYILHPTTGAIAPACYMQDVFVDTAARGRGIGRKLVGAVADIGRKEKWARLYWFAEQNNEAAQALYKKFGVKLNFSLHGMSLK